MGIKSTLHRWSDTRLIEDEKDASQRTWWNAQRAKDDKILESLLKSAKDRGQRVDIVDVYLPTHNGTIC